MMNFYRKKLIKDLGAWLINIFGDFSIRKRFIFFFLLFSLTPIIIIGSISNQNFKKIVTDKIVRYSLAELAQTVVNIQLKLAEYETISLQLFVDKEFNVTLENYVDLKTAFPNNATQKTVEACFNEYMINNNDLFGLMFLCYLNDERSIVVTKDFHNDFSGISKSFKETKSFHNIIKADGGIVWSSAIKVNQNNYIILGRLIKRLSNGQPLGILAIIIDEDKIDQLSNLSIYNDLNNSLNGIQNYSIIINNEGEIISSPFKEDIGNNVSPIIRNIRTGKPISSNSISGQESKTVQGSFVTNVNHKKSLVTYKAIGINNEINPEKAWYLVNLMPTAFLDKERKVVALTTLILGLVFGILAIWISYYAAKMIHIEQGEKSYL